MAEGPYNVAIESILVAHSKSSKQVIGISHRQYIVGRQFSTRIFSTKSLGIKDSRINVFIYTIQTVDIYKYHSTAFIGEL